MSAALPTAGSAASRRAAPRAPQVSPRRLRAGRALAGVALAGTLALVLATGAAAKVIAQGYSYGPRATATATGDIKSTQKPSIMVIAKPAERVTVNWDTICAQTFAPLSTSGAFSAHTPVTRVVTVPKVKKPGQCITTVEAVLHGSGSLTVEVLVG